jgi:hypothetical protein
MYDMTIWMIYHFYTILLFISETLILCNLPLVNETWYHFNVFVIYRIYSEASFNKNIYSWKTVIAQYLAYMINFALWSSLIKITLF